MRVATALSASRRISRSPAAEQPEHANLISGNRGNAIAGAYAQNTHIQGNYIGTDASGMIALPSSGGIVLENLPVKDVVAHRVADNVIGGNLSGIQLVNSQDVERIRNHVGVARDGITPLPNTGSVSGTLTLGTALAEGHIVATGTNSTLGTTSEYSDCRAYSSRVFRDGFE